jgi:type IV secretory pathway VirB2 component (pilin)
MKKITKYLISLAILSLLVLPFLTLPALAQPNDVYGINNVNNGLNNSLPGAGTDLRTVAARIINFVLGFLGIIAVVIILFGGFKWMTAAGNEDKVAEARKLLVAGVIGLVIILAAWAISTFVIGAVYNSING